MRYYTVYDSKAEKYLPPFQAATPAAATRALSAAIRDSSHDFHKFAEDYSLFEIALWDEDSGLITAYDAPKHIVNAWTIKATLFKEE